MYPGGSYEVGPFTQTNPDLQIGFFDAPPAPGSKVDHPLTSGYVDGSYGVNAHSAHKAEAMELVKWMATPEFGQLYANTLKQISAGSRHHARRPAARAGVPELQGPRRDLHDGRRLRLREPARP